MTDTKTILTINTNNDVNTLGDDITHDIEISVYTHLLQTDQITLDIMRPYLVPSEGDFAITYYLNSGLVIFDAVFESFSSSYEMGTLNFLLQHTNG